MARVILRDGKIAELRVVHNGTEDAAILRQLFASASKDSLYLRFFHAVREVDAKVLEDMLAGDGENRLSLMCVWADRVLGVGNYTRTGEDVAEISFFVRDDVQGKGVGSLLLEHLAQTAWRYGFRRFEAQVLYENNKMLQVFAASGYEVRRTLKSGVIYLDLPLLQTERSRALQETREKLATAASLMPFFQPRAVAVIGASRDPNRLGHMLLRHILEGHFQGTVYPVNPIATAVAAVRSYSCLADIPEPVDLAVIAVPAQQVPEVVEQCIQAQVRGVMVISAGFSETGEAGRIVEQALAERLRGVGCRLIGPNSLGILTTDNEVSLNASFAPHLPSQRGMAIASQSGALGVAILEYAQQLGLGISSFVSVGNKADVSSNDLLQFWEDDPGTETIVLYLESFGNPRKFSNITRRITRHKPVLAVKSARTSGGASVSNFPLLNVGSADAVVEALFQQTGIIRLDTLQELFDVAALLSSQPLPKGDNVAIVTNTGGGAVITVDALLREGMQFVQPVIDLGFETLAEQYRQVLPQVLRDPNVDAVVILYAEVGVFEENGVQIAIAEAVEEVCNELGEFSKPIVTNFLMKGDYRVRYISTQTGRIPVYPFPEQAARALGKVGAYARFRRAPAGRMPDLADVDTEAARRAVRQSVERHPLPPEQPLAEQTGNQMGNIGHRVPVIPLASDCVVETLRAVGIHFNPQINPTDGSGLTWLRLSMAHDPLFGPVLKAVRLASTPFNHDAPHSELKAVHRLLPLTDLDTASAVNELLPDLLNLMDPLARQNLGEIFLRVSLLVDQVPEIARMDDFILQLRVESVRVFACRMHAEG
ncbi:GNAT family N-acetyltransferase [Alicyclobacillaceae bacterium I2511]|nr:GNAT family N-acetyltransferase [Alicyclobacillaceae bacterium I2511]